VSRLFSPTVVRLTPRPNAPESERGKEKQGRQRESEYESEGEAICAGVRNRGQQQCAQQSYAHAKTEHRPGVDVVGVRGYTLPGPWRPLGGLWCEEWGGRRFLDVV
jgi:hypothetical protein